MEKCIFWTKIIIIIAMLVILSLLFRHLIAFEIIIGVPTAISLITEIICPIDRLWN